MSNLKLTYQIHRQQERYLLQFDYVKNSPLDKLVRSLPSSTWSASRACWHISAIPQNILILETQLHNLGTINIIQKTDKKIIYNINEKQKDNQQNNNTPKHAKIYLDHERKAIFVEHSYSKELFEQIHKIENAYWIKEQHQWKLSGNNQTYLILKDTLKNNNFSYEKIIKQGIAEMQTNYFVKKFVEALLMKNYSMNTIDAYLPFFTAFVEKFDDRNIDELSYAEIQHYAKQTTETLELSEPRFRHLISAIKFYYEKIKGKPKLYFNIELKKDIKQTKPIYTNEEISEIINKITGCEEKLLMFIYLVLDITTEEITGLTLQESKNILSNNETFADIIIRNTYINLLKTYYNEHKPECFLFEKHKNTPYIYTEIENKIQQAITTNEIGEIYRKEIDNYMTQYGFEYPTRKNYRSLWVSYLKTFQFRNPDTISDQEIRNFIYKLSTHKKKLSASAINQYINVISFYYNKVKNRQLPYETLLRPKLPSKLPTVLSPEEVQRMITGTDNLKHKTMIALLYASGLRRSELLNMQLKDIDLARNVVIVRQGKGKKDRQTMLADSLKEIFRTYIEQYKPKEFLFEGATGDRYSERSLEQVVKAAANKSGTFKHITPHTLRHSFATHLLENAVDIRFIQELLGHASIKTTERYTHVANTVQIKITSPLDKLNLGNTHQNKTKPP